MSWAARVMFALVLVLAAVGVLAGATGMIADRFSADAHRVENAPDPDQVYFDLKKAVSAEVTEPGALPVLVTVESVDLGTLTMNVAITLDLVAAATRLVDETTKRPVVNGGVGQSLRLRVNSSDIEIPLRPADSDRSARVSFWQPAARGTIHLQGRPSNFPDDQYGLSGTAVIEAPDGMAYEIYQGKYSKLLPIGIGFDGDPNLKLWIVSTGPAELGRPSPFEADASMGLKRTPDQVYFIYSVAAAPLLIALTAIVLWMARRRDMRSSVPAIELGVAFLAVLPLRSVLVPSGITDLTKVDKLLGLQMVFVVAGAACAAAGVVLRRSPPDTGAGTEA